MVKGFAQSASQVVLSNAQPSWPPIKVDFTDLCRQNVNTELEIQVWRFDKGGNHQQLGSLATTTVELLDLAATAANAASSRNKLLRRSNKNTSPHFLLRVPGQDQSSGKIFVLSASLVSEEPTQNPNPLASLPAPTAENDDNYKASEQKHNPWWSSVDHGLSNLPESFPYPKTEVETAVKARRIVQEERMAKIRAAQQAAGPCKYFVPVENEERETMEKIDQPQLRMQRQQQVQERLKAAQAQRLAQRRQQEEEQTTKRMQAEGDQIIQPQNDKLPESSPLPDKKENKGPATISGEIDTQIAEALTEKQLRQRKAEDRALRVMEAKRRREQRIADELAKYERQINEETRLEQEGESQTNYVDSKDFTLMESKEEQKESSIPVDTDAESLENEAKSEATKSKAVRLAEFESPEVVQQTDVAPEQISKELDTERLAAVQRAADNVQQEVFSDQRYETRHVGSEAEARQHFLEQNIPLEDLPLDAEAKRMAGTEEEAPANAIAESDQLESENGMEEMVASHEIDEDLDLLDDLLRDTPLKDQLDATTQPFIGQLGLSKASTPCFKAKSMRARSYSPPASQGCPRSPSLLFDATSRTRASQLAFVQRMKSARRKHDGNDEKNQWTPSVQKKAGINVFERLYQNDIATYAAKRINREYYK